MPMPGPVGFLRAHSALAFCVVHPLCACAGSQSVARIDVDDVAKVVLVLAGVLVLVDMRSMPVGRANVDVNVDVDELQLEDGQHDESTYADYAMGTPWK
eukprot:3424672-Amphidinium_carterae.2